MPWGQGYQYSAPAKPKFDWAGFVTQILQGIGRSGGRTGNMWSDLGLGVSSGLGSWQEHQENLRLEAEAKAEALRKENERKAAEEAEFNKSKIATEEDLARRRAALEKIKKLNPARAAEGEFRLNEKGFDEWAAKVLFPEQEEPEEPETKTVDGSIYTIKDGKVSWLYRAPQKPSKEPDESKLTRGKAEDLAQDKAKKDFEAAVISRASTPKGSASPIPDDYDYYLRRARESYGLPPLGGGPASGLPQAPDLSERGGRKVSSAAEPPKMSAEAAATRALDAITDPDKRKRIADAREAGYSDDDIARYYGLL